MTAVGPRKHWTQILRQHGMLHVLQRSLRRRGVHAFRFYWIREPTAGSGTSSQAMLPEGVLMRELESADLPVLLGFPARGAPMTTEHIAASFARGDIGVGIFRGTELLGFSFSSVGHTHTRVWSRTLAADEAYIHNTYVIPQERGKGLAVAINIFQLELHSRRGQSTVYSIVASTNTPALRTKEKIGARRELLGWHLNVRDRVVHSIVLRRLA
jgi:RimJ/RimL family protein N-acetyltransferase